MFEREYRDLAHVPRWAILPTTRVQSVAEHSFYVALYTAEIISFALECGYQVFNDFAIAVQYALVHDRDEAYMSDIPGPIKRNITDPLKMKEYAARMETKVYDTAIDAESDHKRVIKVADLMDEVAFLHGEVRMGNQDAQLLMNTKIKRRLADAIQQLPWFNQEEKTFIADSFAKGITRDKIFPENNDDVAS